MWYLWTALLVVSCALVSAGGAGERPTPATTRAPPRTLDRKAAELAWRTWLQSPESNNQNAPPRRIITKSLFIPPLVCPKGQRLDGQDCVEVLTVDKSEHERLLLNQLNAFFTASPGAGADIVYDYGEDQPGPLQLTLPINLEAQAAPLQGQEPSAQAQELHENYVKLDKKENKKPDSGASSLEAELELLQLQQSQHLQNETSAEGILNHNVLLPFDKPKRDTPVENSTEVIDNVDSEEGQKEVVFGQVNIDPVLLFTEATTSETETETTTTIEAVTEQSGETTSVQSNASTFNKGSNENKNQSTEASTDAPTTEITNLKKEGDKTKLNPESDYADIGEAIKLISRYAEVTTDDNFSKDQKKYAMKDDSILGTRTKLQYRRNKPKPDRLARPISQSPNMEFTNSEKPLQYGNNDGYPKRDVYYRYPWQGPNSPTPPPDYPFRHIQDYWPGQNHVGGVYSTSHENPRRHHHNYPHYYRPHTFPYGNYPGSYPGGHQTYPGVLQPLARRTIAVPHHVPAVRSQANNQDLYSLLGLRHWFSSEGTSKR